MYNAKIKDIEDKISDITNVATNTTLNSKINESTNEIPSITNLVGSASLNAKINEVKNEIPSITNLATNTALTVIENKRPHVSNLVKTQTITQKLVKLNVKLLLIMIMINILLLKNLVNIRTYCCKISTSRFSKQKLFC